MTAKATWLEKRALHVRRIEWARAVPCEDAAAMNAAEGGVDAAAPPDDERGAPVAERVTTTPGSAEALEASERALASRTAELELAEAQLLTLRGQMVAIRAAATDARQALANQTERTLADAESELVKLALAIAERVVGRELATSPELIVGWARAALSASSLGEGVAVAVSSDVAATVDASGWEDLAPRLITDTSLPPSTCELRNGKTTITVGGGDRLALVAEQLAAIPRAA